MRRIKQLEERTDAMIDRLLELQRKYDELYDIIEKGNSCMQFAINTTHKRCTTLVKDNYESLLNNINKHKEYTDSVLKENSLEISATNVRIGRLENPPKFKEGDVVEEKPLYPRDPMGFVMTPSGMPWTPRNGTVLSWYYNKPDDVLVTYKIIADAKDVKVGGKNIPFRDVWDIPEHVLMLKKEEPKKEENKKTKK